MKVGIDLDDVVNLAGEEAACLTDVTRASSSCNTGFIGAITGEGALHLTGVTPTSCRCDPRGFTGRSLAGSGTLL